MSGCCSIFKPYIRFDVGDYISNVYVKNSPCLRAFTAAKNNVDGRKYEIKIDNISIGYKKFQCIVQKVTIYI